MKLRTISTTDPEVGGVNPQLEGVQLAQSEEALFQVVHLAHSLSDALHDDLAVLLHLCGALAKVLPVAEVGLGLRVHREHPGRWEGGGTKVNPLINKHTAN